MNHNVNIQSADCATSMSLAERELTALFGAVKELYGPELADASAQQWLREVESTKHLPASHREWRQVTTQVLSGLVGTRVLSESTDSQRHRTT